MSIRGRITRIVKANRTASAEAKIDPQVRAQDAQRTQHDLLERARRGAADVAAHHHRIGLAANEAATHVRRLEDAAAAAVERGDDDAARAALRESIAARRRLDGLVVQVSEAERQSISLQEDVRRLEARMQQNAFEYDALMARRAAAEAATGVQGALGTSSRETASLDAARRSTEREIRRLEAEARGREELSWSDPSSPRLERAFEELEAEAAAQRELEELKRRHAPGSSS